MILGSKVYALLNGRSTSTAEDIYKVAIPVLGHRLILNFEGEAAGINTADLVEDVIAGLRSENPQ